MKFYKMSFLEACRDGEVELLKKHIKKNSKLNLNIIGARGNSGLMYASLFGYHLCVRVLLEAGADPNVKDCNGNTALYDALKFGNIKCVILLLKGGAYFNKYINNINISKSNNKIIKRLNILYFLKEYYRDFIKLFNYNIITKLITFI